MQLAMIWSSVLLGQLFVLMLIGRGIDRELFFHIKKSSKRF